MSIVNIDIIEHCTFYNENNTIIKIYYDTSLHKYVTNIDIVTDQLVRFYVESLESVESNHPRIIRKEIGIGMNNDCHWRGLPQVQKVDLSILDRICKKMSKFIFEIELSNNTDISYIIFFAIKLYNFCDFGSTLIINNNNSTVLDNNNTMKSRAKIINDKYNINITPSDKFSGLINYINLSCINTINFNFFDTSIIHQLCLITKTIRINIYCALTPAALIQHINSIIKIIGHDNKLSVYFFVSSGYLKFMQIRVYCGKLYIDIDEYYPRNIINDLINTLHATVIILIFSQKYDIEQIKDDIRNNYIVSTNMNHNQIHFYLKINPNASQNIIESTREPEIMYVYTVWTGPKISECHVY